VLKYTTYQFCFPACLLAHTASLRIYSPVSMSICTTLSEFIVLLHYPYHCR